MKTKLVLPIIILCILFVACESQKDELTSEKLVEKMMNSVIDLGPAIYNDKIIVLKTAFCEENDCIEYFQNFNEEIQVFSKEELFMRGLGSYIVIEKDGAIFLNKRGKKSRERVELK